MIILLKHLIHWFTDGLALGATAGLLACCCCWRICWPMLIGFLVTGWLRWEVGGAKTKLSASVPFTLILVMSKTLRFLFLVLAQIDSCFSTRSEAKLRPHKEQATRPSLLEPGPVAKIDLRVGAVFGCVGGESSIGLGASFGFEAIGSGAALMGVFWILILLMKMNESINLLIKSIIYSYTITYKYLIIDTMIYVNTLTAVGFQPLVVGGKTGTSSETLDFESSLSSSGWRW